MKQRHLDQEILNSARYWQEYRDGPLTLEQWRELFHEYAIDDEIDETRARAMLAGENWRWHWADTGFTTFRAAESYAAALMVTDPSEQGDLLVPWKAVRVEVPPGLLETEACCVRWIYVQANTPGDDSSVASLAYSDRQIHCGEHYDHLQGTGAVFRVRQASTLADVLWFRNAEELDWLQGKAVLNEEKERLMLLCANYVSGLFYTLQHTRDWSAKQHKNHYGWQLRSGPRPPPMHRNVVCGLPIAVNLREMVRAQARGESRLSAPSMFQSCVRGHYKRQVIGVGRTGRKVVWIEPYWRGPEGAPLLVRPYEFS